VTSKWGNGVG